MKKKTGRELLLDDVTKESSLLSRNRVFVGQKCAKLIRNLELTPSSTQLDDFFAAVYKFHKRVSVQLQGFFAKGLSSVELQYMAAFSPSNRTKVSTADDIMFSSFSKIVDVIRPGDGFDKLGQELQLLSGG